MAENNLTGQQVIGFAENIEIQCNVLTQNLDCISNSFINAMATSTLGNTNSEMHDVYMTVGETANTYSSNLKNLIKKMADDVRSRADKISNENEANAQVVNRINQTVDELNKKAEAIANKYASE